MKVALITPTYAKDQQLLDLCCRLIDRHSDGTIDHFVLHSSAERRLFRHLSGTRRHLIYKEDLFSQSLNRLPFCIRGKEVFFLNYHRPVRGWILQQLVKLCSPAVTDADVFVYIDSDVCFIRPFSSSSFMFGERIRFLRKPGFADIEPHRRWHSSAGKLLGLPQRSYYGADYIGHLVCWRRDTCTELQSFLQAKWLTDWKKVVIGEKDISEYILYGVFVDKILSGDIGRHHATNVELCLSSWYFEADASLTARMAHALKDFHIAINIQSNLKQPVATYLACLEEISKKLAPKI